MANGNTDPATFVSIGQDPTKPAGWNVVTLSDGTVAKYAGIVERGENGLVVQRIALNTPDGQDTFDGPVLTLASALAIQAFGGEIPPIHQTVKVSSAAPPAPASASPAPAPVPSAPVGTPEHHASLLDRLRAIIDAVGGAFKDEAHKILNVLHPK